jgi:hypothetical protein
MGKSSDLNPKSSEIPEKSSEILEEKLRAMYFQQWYWE